MFASQDFGFTIGAQVIQVGAYIIDFNFAIICEAYFQPINFGCKKKCDDCAPFQIF